MKFTNCSHCNFNPPKGEKRRLTGEQFMQWRFLFYVFLISSTNQAPGLGAEMLDKNQRVHALSEMAVHQVSGAVLVKWHLA